MSETPYSVKFVSERWAKSTSADWEVVREYRGLAIGPFADYSELLNRGILSMVLETLGSLPLAKTITRKELVQLALTRALAQLQLTREVRINLQKIWRPLVEYCASGSPDFNPVCLQLYDWVWAAVQHPYAIDNPGYYHVLGLDFVRYIDQDNVEVITQIQLNNVASRFQALLV